MPLLAVPIEFPAELVAIHAADVNGDGRDELILESAFHKGRQPDAVILTVLQVDDNGKSTSVKTIDLGRRPILWDAGPGLWGLGPNGAEDLWGDAPAISLPTALSALATTSPKRAKLLSDVDHNGAPELLAYGKGGLLWVDLTQGTSQTLKASAQGALSTDTRRGGQQVSLTLRWPRTEIADIDGDGTDDIVQLNGDHLLVWSGAAPSTNRRIALPIDIDPYEDPATPPSADRRPVERVWLKDVNHDGKADLVVHRAVLSGSWVGATAELSVCLGTGAAFSAPQTVTTDSAAVDLQLEDVDSDNDLDLVVPQVDITLSNFARALLARRMEVEVNLYSWDKKLSTTPVLMRAINIPIENNGTLQVEMTTDMTGDGLADMLYHEGDGPIELFPGSLKGVSSTPWASVSVPVPAGDESLFVHDFTGDGIPEVLVWGPGQARGSLLRVTAR